MRETGESLYNIFGLTVASDLPLPEAAPAREGAQIDVYVSFGEICFDILSHPETCNPGGTWHYCLPEPGKLYFRCRGVDFAVAGGDSVVIDTHGRSYNPDSLRIFLLGTALGGINMMRGNIPVHGAAVMGKDGVTIITGYSGTGKSAILGALAQEGYRYLTDDVSVVTLRGGAPVVLPAYPQRKIAEDTARELEYDTSGLERIEEDEREKYVIRRREEWYSDPAPLRALVEIAPAEHRDGKEFSPNIKEISGHAALGLVMRNLYRRGFYEKMGIEPERMKKLLLTTSQIRTWRIIRPINGFSVRETARMIAEKSLDAEG